MADVRLETDRLLLRQWRASDREPFAALNADPIVMAHFPSVLNRQQSDSIADECERSLAQNGWGVYAVEIKASGLFIGFVGLHIPSATLPISPCVEVLWRLAHPFWHQGFATEAARTVLQVGFESLQVPEIVSYTALPNVRSQAVMRRLGMIRDAATFEHPAVPPGHMLRIHCSYRLSHGRWFLGRELAAAACSLQRS